MSDITVNLDNAVVIEIEVPAAVPIVIDPQGIPGDPGEQGNDGWSAVLANVTDGERRVQQVVNWIGGTGTPPAVGKYVGGAGYVDNIADAIDMRGDEGAQGQQGEPGEPGAVIIGEGVDILTGEGPPDPALGVGNQLYLDTLTGDVYKKEVSDEEPDGVWTIVANIRGPAGPQGQDGEQGEDGEQGLPGVAGWSPVFANAVDGARRVLQLTDWTGGAGTKPGFIGQYVSAVGFTNIIANAIDIRGLPGADGEDGTPGLPGVAGSSVLAGTGAPANGLGNPNDLYFDLGSGDLYGPKVGGAWGAPAANLVGPQGLQGEQGEQGIQGEQGVAGNDGDDGADGSSILAGNGAPSDALGSDRDIYLNRLTGDLYGPKSAGTWGAISGNIKGPAGDDGLQGPPGDAGEAGPQGIPGDVGPAGEAGDDGADGATIHVGTTVPDNALGNDGDLYVRTTTGDLYGPKAAGAWGAIAGNLMGPQGPTGEAGEDGAPGAPGADGSDGTNGASLLSGAGVPDPGLGVDGNSYLNTTNGDVYGPKTAGSWGSPTGNIRGPTGADGEDGAPGEQGPAGEQGEQGTPGIDGADGFNFLSGAGAPSGGLGNDGDSYLNVSNGDVYHKASGAWGSPAGNLKGASGADGSDGDDGANGASYLSGAGVPSSGLGSNGDSYINVTNGDTYGPKTAGAWGSVTGNLKGPAGTAGAAGANGNVWLTGTTVPAGGTGNNGDYYLRTTTGDMYGPKAAGAWGSIIGNLQGPAGADGIDGGEALRSFRANKNAAQTAIPVSTPTKVTWQTEVDASGEFDLPNSRWMPQIPGPVFLMAAVQVAGTSGATFNAGTNISLNFQKNGASIGVVNTRVQAAQGTMIAFGAVIDTAAPGDYFELFVQTGAVSAGGTFEVSNNTSTYFSGFSMQGSKGADGNKIILGAGVPSSGLGNNGDNYIDSATGNMYGPKAAGAWGASTGSLGGGAAYSGTGNP